MLYLSGTWPVIEENVIKLEKNDARMVRWRCTVWPQDCISPDKLRPKQKLNNTRECLQWLDHMERMQVKDL